MLLSIYLCKSTRKNPSFKNRIRRNNIACIQLIFITLCFTVGLAPMIVHSIMLHQFESLTDCRTILNFHIAHTVSLMALRLSETINPFIYSIGSEDLLNSVKTLFRMKSNVPRRVPNMLPTKIIYNSIKL